MIGVLISRPEQVKGMVRAITIPLRLLDCFGFATPSALAVVVFGALAMVDGRLGAVLVVGRGTVAAGLFKKAEGEGTLIVAMNRAIGCAARTRS